MQDGPHLGALLGQATMIVMHLRQITMASFDGRRGALKGLDPVGRPRCPRRQDLGGQPLRAGVSLKRASHRFQGLLHLGCAAAATRARHLLVPIHHRQEALVHPLLPSGRQDAWRHILPHPLPPNIHQGREGRSLLADFVQGVGMCR
jgi:hypothetical protein